MGKQSLLCVGFLAFALGTGVSGCASTKVTKLTKAAPITYKIGKGAGQLASLPMRPKTPRTLTTPAPYNPPAISSVPAPMPGQSFDQASVDRDLYKHQRVGKRYKIMGKSYTPKHNPDYDEVGIASFYGKKFHGKPTATGETFNMNDLTAAHKTLPLNSMLFVTNLENGRTLMVRLNDRGPFVGGRIIDLSKASAHALGITTNQGLSKVRVQYAGPADPMAADRPLLPRQAQEVPYPEDNYVQAPQVTAPAPRPAAPLPRAQDVMPSPIAPSTPRRAAPIAPAPEGGDVTLTIKGPIHVAKHDSTASKVRVIPAVYRTEK